MIILTGASGAIGSELVAPLSAIDEVLGLCNRNSPASQRDNVRYVRIDLEDPEAITAFVNSEREHLTKVVIVHAAVHKVDALVAQIDVDAWDAMMRVNLRANMLLNQALLPIMIQQRWGSVVHFSSRGGEDGRPGTGAYSTCKAGLSGLSNVLAQEYARFNVTSNILVLGYFESKLFRELQKEEQQRLLNAIPSKALGNVKNIANAIAFLMQSDYVNGASIRIDGGARQV